MLQNKAVCSAFFFFFSLTQIIRECPLVLPFCQNALVQNVRLEEHGPVIMRTILIPVPLETVLFNSVEMTFSSNRVYWFLAHRHVHIGRRKHDYRQTGLIGIVTALQIKLARFNGTYVLIVDKRIQTEVLLFEKNQADQCNRISSFLTAEIRMRPVNRESANADSVQPLPLWTKSWQSSQLEGERFSRISYRVFKQCAGALRTAFNSPQYRS